MIIFIFVIVGLLLGLMLPPLFINYPIINQLIAFLIFTIIYIYFKISTNNQLRKNKRKIEIFKEDIKKDCVKIKVDFNQCDFKTVKDTEIKPSSYLTDVQFFNFLVKSKKDIMLKTTHHTQILYKHKSFSFNKNFYSQYLNIDKITLEALLYNQSFYIFYNRQLNKYYFELDFLFD